MAQGTSYPGGLAEIKSSRAPKSPSPYRDFHAIEYSLSGKLAVYYVGGEVLVGNPGIEAVLNYHVPQGTNPKILMLDLCLIQRPGVWPAVETWVSTKYIRMGKPGQYTDVQILGGPMGNFTIKVLPLP